MKKAARDIHKEAITLVRKVSLLYLVGRVVAELGVVGEERNSRILFLAALTKELEAPVSVLIKGATSSGKSNLLRTTLQVIPPESVIVLASLSKKAPVHGKGSLQGKIIYLSEYRGAKDAQYLLRLQQSEGEIAHEFTTISGARRGTRTVRREGFPVIFTTTTRARVQADDETRFLSLWVDDSASQTLAIVRARIVKRSTASERELAVWQEAVRLLTRNVPSFRFAAWFDFVAAKLPVDQVRVRRDWSRFLSLCMAVELCQRYATGQEKTKEIPISFAAYCIAYDLLNSAMASTVVSIPEQEFAVVQSVRRLRKRLGQAVTVKEVAGDLRWKNAHVYKHAKTAVEKNLIQYEAGIGRKGLRRLLPVPESAPGFLPTPREVFYANQEIGRVATYIDPVTGETKFFRRKRIRGNKWKASSSKSQRKRLLYTEGGDV